MIRGVKTVEVRSWYAKHAGGRIAIHASANIELKKVEAVWADDRAVAQCFADQGWTDRDDLRALPRSALLGTVELTGVHRAQAVRAANVNPSAGDWIADALDNAVRDPATGHLIPGPAPARTLPVSIPEHGWVLGFARALAVEPVTGVDGQQHLWTLPAAVAAELSAREARTRAGAWTSPRPAPERVRAAHDKWRERFDTEAARYAKRLMQEALSEVANDMFTLEDERAEAMLKQQVQRMATERGEVGPDGRTWIRVPKALRALFDGALRVPVVQFESDVRVLMTKVRHRAETDAAYRTVWDAAVKRVQEGLASAEQSPSSRTALEAEVKRAFKREWLAAEAALVREDHVVRLPDY